MFGETEMACKSSVTFLGATEVFSLLLSEPNRTLLPDNRLYGVTWGRAANGKGTATNFDQTACPTIHRRASPASQ